MCIEDFLPSLTGLSDRLATVPALKGWAISKPRTFADDKYSFSHRGRTVKPARQRLASCEVARWRKRPAFTGDPDASLQRPFGHPATALRLRSTQAVCRQRER
jgi:hypothetical protein